MTITVVVAGTSDNSGGITVADRARDRSSRFAKLWCDSGFKTAFISPYRHHHVGVDVVNRIHPHCFVAPPQTLDRRLVLPIGFG